MKNLKYDYYKVIQQNYGQGYEDASHYVCTSQGFTTELSGKFRETKTGRKIEISLLKADLDEYRFKCPYPTRVIFRKERKTI